MREPKSTSGWSGIPVGATAAFETCLARHKFVTNWVRREPDVSDGVRLISWQELDLEALHRPGGLIRTITDIILRPTLEPERIELQSAKGTAVIRFNGGGASVQLIDGTRVTVAGRRWAFPLLDNAVALYSFVAQVLHAQRRLPLTGAVFCPGTLSSLEYSIARGSRGWRTSLGEQLSFDRSGRLAAISLKAQPDVSIRRVDAVTPRWRSLGQQRATPTRRPSARVVSRDLRTRYDGHDVWGRLVSRSKKRRVRAAVLLIGGSGLHDRFGMATGIDIGYAALVERLASRDIVCLQFDKPGAGRTRQHRRGRSRRFNDAIGLARAWWTRLSREVPAGTPTFLMGHSEGGQIALCLAAERRRALQGVVLLATAGRPIDEVLSDQVLNEAKDLGLDMRATRRRLLRLRGFFGWLRSAGRAEPLPERFKPFQNQRHWYRGLLDTAPEQSLPSIKAPLLILQGDRDIQVSVADAEELARLARESCADVTLDILPGLDHLFKPSPKVLHTALYGDARRRFSAKAIERIIDWILEHRS